MAITIEYGVPTDKCGVPLRLGIEKGFFRAEGLDLSLRVVFGGPEIAAEYDSGRLEIGELGTPPGLTAIGKGALFKIVGSSIRRGAVQYLCINPKFADWSELKGARLGALSRGSCSYWFMREVLDHHGLDPDKDVTIVGLGSKYPRVVELIEQGELDGAIISEPNVTMGDHAGAFKVWLGLNSVDFVPRMQWSIAVANIGTIERDPEMIAAVLRGCRQSYRYAAAHRDEWAAFGARLFNIEQRTMKGSIDREFDDLHFDCQVDVEGLEAAIVLQRKLGAFPEGLRAADVADLRFQDALPPLQSAAN